MISESSIDYSCIYIHTRFRFGLKFDKIVEEKPISK